MPWINKCLKLSISQLINTMIVHAYNLLEECKAMNFYSKRARNQRYIGDCLNYLKSILIILFCISSNITNKMTETYYSHSGWTQHYSLFFYFKMFLHNSKIFCNTRPLLIILYHLSTKTIFELLKKHFRFQNFQHRKNIIFFFKERPHRIFLTDARQKKSLPRYSD